MRAPIFAGHSATLRRIGAAGFVFFLAKGMLWLLAPFIFLWFA